ncbi:2173_t:CDS:10 [Paraglomus occultum]|uniref:2173_t:CDS:1 n=1 Tax=Paraglomus occultum TaxID=144539 RepID=A0A9N8W050_9GLOM|nr:2173_t:CDS:10 [Paraglomus occultum]
MLLENRNVTSSNVGAGAILNMHEICATFNWNAKNLPSPTTWTVDQVCCWLRGLGLMQVDAVCHAFREHEVDGLLLLGHINNDVLTKELCLTSWGTRTKILKAIEDLKAGIESATASPVEVNGTPSWQFVQENEISRLVLSDSQTEDEAADELSYSDDSEIESEDQYVILNGVEAEAAGFCAVKCGQEIPKDVIQIIKNKSRKLSYGGTYDEMGDDDILLPLYGDSEDENKMMDSDLEKEVEKEEQTETERAKKRYLDCQKSIDKYIENVQKKLKVKHEALKREKPEKYEQKRWNLWRKWRNRQEELKTEMEHLNQKRIPELIDELHKNFARTSKDFLRQCGILDVSLKRIFEIEWTLNVLSGGQPHKPSKTGEKSDISGQFATNAILTDEDDFESHKEDSEISEDSLSDFIDESDLFINDERLAELRRDAGLPVIQNNIIENNANNGNDEDIMNNGVVGCNNSNDHNKKSKDNVNKDCEAGRENIINTDYGTNTKSDNNPNHNEDSEIVLEEIEERTSAPIVDISCITPGAIDADCSTMDLVLSSPVTENSVDTISPESEPEDTDTPNAMADASLLAFSDSNAENITPNKKSIFYEVFSPSTTPHSLREQLVDASTVQGDDARPSYHQPLCNDNTRSSPAQQLVRKSSSRSKNNVEFGTASKPIDLDAEVILITSDTEDEGFSSRQSIRKHIKRTYDATSETEMSDDDIGKIAYVSDHDSEFDNNYLEDLGPEMRHLIDEEFIRSTAAPALFYKIKKIVDSVVCYNEPNATLTEYVILTHIWNDFKEFEYKEFDNADHSQAINRNLTNNEPVELFEEGCFAQYWKNRKKAAQKNIPNLLSVVARNDDSPIPKKRRLESEAIASTHSSLTEDLDIRHPEILAEIANQTRKGKNTLRTRVRPESVRTITMRTQRRAREAAYRLRYDQQSATDNMGRAAINRGHEAEEDDIYIPLELSSELKQYQIEGTQFLWKNIVMFETGCTLAHAMGLGKTVQVITFLYTLWREMKAKNKAIPQDLMEHGFRVLILCPSTVIDNWMVEFNKWLRRMEGGREFCAHVGKFDTSMKEDERLRTLNKWHRLERGGVIITNYEMISRSCFREQRNIDEYRKCLIDPGPSLIIADEGHKFKSEDTLLMEALRDLRTRNRICLTGSPLQNSLKEYYSTINFVCPNYLGDREEFEKLYINPIESGLAPNALPASHKSATIMLYVLKKIINDIVLRKDESLLAGELPEKQDYVIFCRYTEDQRKLYELSKKTEDIYTLQQLSIANTKRSRSKNARSIISNTPEEDDRYTSVVAEKIRDYQKTHIPDIEDIKLSNKMLVLMEILKQCRIENDKVLVFSKSLPTLDYVEKQFRKWQETDDSIIQHTESRTRIIRIDGEVDKSQRHHMIDSFNERPDWAVALISIKTASLGVNLFGANRVVLFDCDWNPTHAQQAVGRAYRIGQTKRVFVYRLMVHDSFEERLFNNNVQKVGLSNRVIDNTATQADEDVGNLAYLAEPKDPGICRIPPEATYDDNVLNVVSRRLRDGLITIEKHETYYRSVDENLDESEQKYAEDCVEAEIQRLTQSRGLQVAR